MSGKDVKRQVMEALRLPGPHPLSQGKALDALAPCTVLTPEERENIRDVLVGWCGPGGIDAALALLTDEGESDA